MTQKSIVHYCMEQDSIIQYGGIISSEHKGRAKTAAISLTGKNVVDFLLSVGILIFSFPLFCILSLAIAFTSKGPIIFRQSRIGLNGTCFDIYKFRTMYIEQEDKLAHKQTERYDPRVTSVGRILRKTSLDELPQIFNVIRGEMSLVGPRPHALGMTVEDSPAEDSVPFYSGRYRMKPGITGLAQVNGSRGAVHKKQEMVERIQYDNYYIENWTLMLDLKILIKTSVCLLRCKNVY